MKMKMKMKYLRRDVEVTEESNKKYGCQKRLRDTTCTGIYGKKPTELMNTYTVDGKDKILERYTEKHQ